MHTVMAFFIGIGLAAMLRALEFVRDYTVIVTRDGRAERWRGPADRPPGSA